MWYRSMALCMRGKHSKWNRRGVGGFLFQSSDHRRFNSIQTHLPHIAVSARLWIDFKFNENKKIFLLLHIFISFPMPRKRSRYLYQYLAGGSANAVRNISIQVMCAHARARTPGAEGNLRVSYLKCSSSVPIRRHACHTDRGISIRTTHATNCWCCFIFSFFHFSVEFCSRYVCVTCGCAESGAESCHLAHFL